ncbi:STAS domain-containing protein [Streptomyces sp. NBC_00237]|uniref:STAS domain-containing protein n=1 Tax=Streptomyces sp. NBC_00237 TaxID=2975687 RepID=UPI0022505137|nr:STAS domain-containing protein [Streptomyces sp. NBC_00237]MCX5199950.1 STAS domain-containing protein [Streptomyces sp. NBC_00237]
MKFPVRKRPPDHAAHHRVGFGQVTTVPLRLTLRDLPCLPHLPRCTLLLMPPEIDIANSDDLYAAVREAVDQRRDRADVLVLDFTRTTFTDSRGARLISATREYAERSGITVRLAVPESGVVRRVVTLTGIRRDVPVYASVADAVAGDEEL